MCCWRESPDAASPLNSRSSATYLTRLNEAYSRFFHEYEEAPLLIVNAASMDPIGNQADYADLLIAIGRVKSGRNYYNAMRHATI